MSEWISVRDRLPEETGRYLCCYLMDGHRFYNDRWFDKERRHEFKHGFQSCEDITHWTLLIEPPNAQ